MSTGTEEITMPAMLPHLSGTPGDLHTWLDYICVN